MQTDISMQDMRLPGVGKAKDWSNCQLFYECFKCFFTFRGPFSIEGSLSKGQFSLSKTTWPKYLTDFLKKWHCSGDNFRPNSLSLLRRYIKFFKYVWKYYEHQDFEVESANAFLHDSLKGWWSVCDSLGHPIELPEPHRCDERGFVFVLFSHFDLIVAGLYYYYAKVLCHSWAGYGLERGLTWHSYRTTDYWVDLIGLEAPLREGFRYLCAPFLFPFNTIFTLAVIKMAFLHCSLILPTLPFSCLILCLLHMFWTRGTWYLWGQEPLCWTCNLEWWELKYWHAQICLQRFLEIVCWPRCSLDKADLDLQNVFEAGMYHGKTLKL